MKDNHQISPDIHELCGQFSGHELERILPPGAGTGAVLIPVMELEDGLYILFEERSRNIRQGGDICFPGGMAAEGEPPEETAVRETCEELLLDRQQVRLIAPMHEVSGPGGALVRSYLGVIDRYDGNFNRAEAACTFAVPLSWFVRNPPDIYKARQQTVPADDFPYEKIAGGRNYRFREQQKHYYFYEVPAEVIFEWNGKTELKREGYITIWGLTAMLLYHFVKKI